MIRTRALELQGGRDSGAWKVRLGAGIRSASILPQLTADKPKGCPYADGFMGAASAGSLVLVVCCIVIGSRGVEVLYCLVVQPVQHVSI